MALARGAATAVVADDRLAGLGRTKGSLTIVDDVLDALRRLGRRRARAAARRIAAVTGSVGKTGTKEMLAAALAPDGPVHFSPASFNNHWGVPLTLARMPQRPRYGVFEIGMNHAGEIAPLAKMVRPHVADRHHGRAGASRILQERRRTSPAPRPRSSSASSRAAPRSSTATIRTTRSWPKLARDAGVERIVGFGEHQARRSAARQVVKLKPECSCVSARILGEEISYKLGAPGRHLVQNSLAVLGAVSLLGGDLAKAALALAGMPAPKGRGARHRLALGGTARRLIDESYNANPASMRAAIALLGQAPSRAGGPPHRRPRRHARARRDRRADCTPALAEPLAEAEVDRVFLAGPLMRALWDALPSHQRGGYAETAAELEPLVLKALAPGDVVMVKGSNASRMGPLVEALKARFAPARAAAEDRQEQEIA